jgi:hypothetical protein
VFCLLDGEEKKLVNPLNRGHWKFFAVETKDLMQKYPTAKTLGLLALQKLCEYPFDYKTLKNKIKEIEKARNL